MSVVTPNHYPVGWLGARHAQPFQWAKRIASHYGGTRDAMISWPARIKDKVISTMETRIGFFL